MKFIISLLFIPLISISQTQIGNRLEGESDVDRFGDAVSISCDGTIISVGGRFNGTREGHVRIFENINDNWSQIGQDVDGVQNFEEFGSFLSSSCDGSIIASSAPFFDSNGVFTRGAVRVFENISNNWVQIGNDIIGDSESDTLGTGMDLSCDGNIIVVGAPGGDDAGSESGEVMVFQNNGGNWEQMGNTIIGLGLEQGFGFTVSLSCDGHTFAASAPNNSDNFPAAGQARVFTFDETSETWMQVGQNIQGEGTTSFLSEVDLSCDGTRLAVGASGDDESGENSGQVEVYEFDGKSSWNQIGQDLNSNDTFAQFGRRIKLSCDGNRLAAAAPNGDLIGGPAGSRRGFVDLYQLENNQWVLLGNRIEGGVDNDILGESIDLSSDGSILVIGIPTFRKVPGFVEVYDFKNTLSIDELTINDTDIAVYPIPSATHIQVKLSNNLSGLKKVRVFDVTGKEVITSNYNWLNISSLNVGVYYTQIELLDGVIVTRKIVRN